jgi:sigma-B regulation protein RsbU (phosphoserine phosphatase)
LLAFINDHLTARYTADSGKFVTAFYGIYDPATRSLDYASAGHNPPRLRKAGTPEVRPLDREGSLPLGIDRDVTYADAREALAPGDALLLYTDGITEARAPGGEMFGVERLDRLLAGCDSGAPDLLATVLEDLRHFAAGRPAGDDRTLLAVKVK